MTKGVEKIKNDLIKKREDLIKDLQELSKKDVHETDSRTASFPEYGDKADENAQEISEYSTVIVAERVLEKSINEIEATLKRIESGEYGVCRYCGGEIGEKRLEARPTANSCITCKTKLQEGDA